ncbi:MAG: recombination-associated protein RdgC [Lentisphaeraceae bacterium]|nr:recombination-associated protein RdgC [Lentisphaeraceae bacterium]
MPFDNGSISFSVYRVNKELPEDKLEKFAAHSGCLPEKVTDTPNLGWVARHLLERRIDSDTAIMGDFLHLHFRTAVRKIPTSLLHAECKQRELAAMQADNISSLSRKKKKEVKEEVEEELLKFMPPQLGGTPIVYDEQTKLLYIGSSSVTQSDSVIQLFMETLDVDAVPKTPMVEAMLTLNTERVEMDPLDFSGKGFSKDEELNMGRDFLTWMWFLCEAEDGKFTVPDLGEFCIGLDGPLSLVAENMGAHESVLRKGLPTLSPEAHQALCSGKKLKSARVSFTRGDEIWTFTLDADNFIFKSLKLPDGEAMDVVSRFEERMTFLDTFQEAY